MNQDELLRAIGSGALPCPPENAEYNPRERARQAARNVMISPAMNGWIVEVGCQRAVFTTWGALIANLQAYFENPEPVERQWAQLKLDFS